MGMRHVVVVNGELEVVGIITRSEMNEHHLAHFWKEEVCRLQYVVVYMNDFITF